MTLDPHIADRLRALRQAAHLSQLQLAARAGTSLTTVHSIERIGMVPRSAILTKIATALGVRVEELRAPQRRSHRPEPARKAASA